MIRYKAQKVFSQSGRCMGTYQSASHFLKRLRGTCAFAAIGFSSLNGEEGVSERSLPLIYQQYEAFQSNVASQPPENTTSDLNEKYPLDSCDKRRVLYLMSKGETKRAIEQYLAYYKKHQKHDRQILHEIATILLENGAASNDFETQLLTLCGISLSHQPSSLDFLEKALQSRFPMVQSVALSLLGNMHEDECNDIIATAMRSRYLMVRYEALYYLIARKSKHALGYVESLANLLHPSARPIFIEFYAMYGSKEARQRLKQFLNDNDLNVRIAAIGAINNHRYDDLLPNIRSLLSRPDPTLKEACAATLGAMSDLSSIENLKIAADSPFDETSLAALFALHQLGDREAEQKIIALAKKHNPFAIFLLSRINGHADLLAKMATNVDNTVRLNASLALLHKRDPRCLPVIQEILNADIQYVGFAPFVSKGRSLVAWKTIPPSAIKHPDIKRNIQAITLSLIQEVMTTALELPEKDFLKLARGMLSQQHCHNISLLMHLLGNIKSDNVIALLKEKSQEVGSPLVRGYASLALYRMGEGEAFRQNFLNWLKNQKGEQLIEFQPMMDRGAREDKADSNYQLSPADRSALLLEAFDTLATKHELEGIELLLEAMQNGHPKNRYALAGLLLKSIH